MPDYTLGTLFSKEDLTRFHASGSNVVVAKPNAGGAPNVAWVVYNPLEENTMTWDEEYGIYASNTDIVGGALLVQMSHAPSPVEDGMVYPFTVEGFFGSPSSGGVTGSYTVQNEYKNDKGYMTIGLYQNAVVNDKKTTRNAISAALVQREFTAEMTPFTSVYLWIQSQVKSNSVVTNVTSAQTEVRFGGSVSEVSLAYEAATGRFRPAQKSLPDGISLVHHVPTLL